jgi:aryl-alcohol dehydrogenase-like predicted oxidoreductase
MMLRRPSASAEVIDSISIAASTALAWVLRNDGVTTIPGSGNPEHVRENAAALDIRLTAEDLAALDGVFPPPRRPMPLEVL